MRDTKLIKVLKTFSDIEMKKFRDFVKSPYYNKNKNVIKLFEVISKFHPRYDSDMLSEEKIFKKIFVTEKFDYFKIKNISSDLYRVVLEYFKNQTNDYTCFFDEYNLLVQLRLRKLHSLHKKSIDVLEKNFDKSSIQDSTYLNNYYHLSTEIQLSDVLEKPNSYEGIKKEFDSFFEYSVLTLLKYYNMMMHVSKENNVSMNMRMLHDMINFIENNDVSSNPTIIAYRYIVLLSYKRKEEYYFILKNHYFENFKNMSFEDSYYSHMYIFGYCMDMYNIQGDRRFIKECYDLFRHAFEHKMVAMGELLYPDFINFVKVFTRQGDVEISKKFIDVYKEKLPEDQYENCINFSNALISHKEGNLNRALELVSMVNFSMVLLKLQAKLLQVQLNYELGYFEETREIIESFKKTFQKEESISDLYKNSILNFLKLTVSLINISQETDRREKEFAVKKLHNELSSGQPNHFGIKFWLEDRLEETGLLKSFEKIPAKL